MRLAWFTPAVVESSDTALLIRALAAAHHIDIIDSTRAHDFVWQHARNPWDLAVFELGGSPAHEFVAAYAAHFPGLTLLRGLPRHDRALRASRVVVVPNAPSAEALADDYPGIRIRTLVPGVEPVRGDDPIVEALRWPPDGAGLTSALAGFAAGKAVIVFDGTETADWPSLDPQNWQVRGPVVGSAPDPICVSIDPRDQAHSMKLARTRLESDEALRRRLGAAARAWWREHATVDRAAAGFQSLLEEACTASDPPGAKEADAGTSKVEDILNELGLGSFSARLGR